MTRSQSPSLSSVGAYVDAAEHRRALGFVHLALGDLPRQQAVDGGEAGLTPLFGDVVQHDGQAGLGADLGDAASPSARRR